MKTLVLDFDGVIADSQMECLFLGFNAYLEFNKSTKLFDGKKFTFDNFNFLAQKHRKSVEQYKALRPYVIDAFCYYVIAHIVENSIAVKSQEEYDDLRNRLSKDVYADFVELFHSKRKRLVENNINEWLGLVTPYKKVVSAIKMLSSSFDLAISTNNRKFAIDAFSRKHGINPKVVFDSSFGSDKKVHIEKIHNELGAGFDEIYFVDDQVRHFPKLLKLGVNCCLATWGYNTKEQHEEAKKLGVELLAQENFHETFARIR